MTMAPAEQLLLQEDHARQDWLISQCVIFLMELLLLCSQGWRNNYHYKEIISMCYTLRNQSQYYPIILFLKLAENELSPSDWMQTMTMLKVFSSVFKTIIFPLSSDQQPDVWAGGKRPQEGGGSTGQPTTRLAFGRQDIRWMLKHCWLASTNLQPTVWLTTHLCEADEDTNQM